MAIIIRKQIKDWVEIYDTNNYTLSSCFVSSTINAENIFWTKDNSFILVQENKNYDYSEIRRQLDKYKNVQGLMRYVNVPSLKEIHRKQPKNKALGIDGKTKEEYNSNLDENLNNLIDSMKHYKYYPNPVKRTNIPKANGKLRPLGIPSYEDRLVQANMAEILNVMWEPIFLDCSFGFKPKTLSN